MQIIELFSTSKSGDPDNNEDGIYFDGNFVAVIDGATAKSPTRKNHPTAGRVAMLAVKEAFSSINPNDCPVDIVRGLNNSIKENFGPAYRSSEEDPPIASIIYYNDRRKEIVSYGDCICAVNGKSYNYKKRSDIRLARKRAAVIRQELKKGVSIDDIRKNDVGRAAIINELREQAALYANNPNDGFPCINGGNVVERFLRVYKVNSGDMVELASDGYTELLGSLSDSEKKLRELLKKDVLCIDELLSTKCVSIGNVSFDDRSYIRFLI